LWEFTRARLLRIVPAFALVLLVCAYFIGPLLSARSMAEYFRDPAVPAYVWKNLRFGADMAWQLPGLFQGNVRDAVNGSIWTLPAEMRMYVLTAALGAFGLLSRRWLGSACLLALVVLALTRPEFIPMHPDWLRLAGFFALGILVQLHKDRLQVRHSAMAMLVFLLYLSMQTRAMPWLFAFTLAYFCFWFAYRTPVWRQLERWGDPSYGIYLWGWPLQQILVAKLPAMAAWHNFLLAAVLATCMGYLSWWCLERPALKLKHWHPRMSGAGASSRSNQPNQSGDGAP
jgi:peptidoglycan/LPS O-acetylase OafA/YrhL